MDWYYAESGKQIGPVDDASFQNLVGAGLIRDETLVWRAGLANWLPYQNVRPVPASGVDGVADSGLRYCSECGKPFPSDELVAFGPSMVCAACKPIYAQKLVEGVRLPGAVRYGGFWIRFLAIIIDGVALNIAGVFISGIALAFFNINWAQIGRSPADLLPLLQFQGVLLLANLLLAAAYEIWMIGRFGATLGKMVCHLKVETSEGGSVSYLRSLGRHFAKFLNAFTLGIGYIMAGIDDEKRALHDRICSTRVVKK